MQKIMEPIFEITYLLFAIIIGVVLIFKAKKDKTVLIFGIMTFILGVGDAFHLIPRIIGLLTDGLDHHVFSLGLGKLVTSITMTVFYVLFYLFFKKRYNINGNLKIEISLYSFALIRIILCILPQNEWFKENSSYLFGIIRNIPFWIIGLEFVIYTIVICKNDKYFKFTPLAVFLSFIFYTGTVLFASKYSWTGMLMLPKTLCYIFIIIMGISAFKKESKI